MTNAVLYYVPDSSETGQIVALAPSPLRDEDRPTDWQIMRITEGERRMFIEGNESTTNWFVHLDAATNVHRLMHRKQQTYQSYSNLLCLWEALPQIEDPELIIEREEDRIYLRLGPGLDGLDQLGKAEFWITAYQDYSLVYGYRLVDLNLGTSRRWLFSYEGGPTSIYTNSRYQRVHDARHA